MIYILNFDNSIYKLEANDEMEARLKAIEYLLNNELLSWESDFEYSLDIKLKGLDNIQEL